MTTNADLLTRRNTAVVRGIGHTTPLSASRARNAELWDVEGKRYVNFSGGIAVVNTGHCHPRIIAAVQEQMERFTHTCFQVVMYEPYTALAERLNALVPVSGAVKSAYEIVVTATRGQTEYGICSTTFLEQAFRTNSYQITITFHPDGSWSYVTDTELLVHGRDAPFAHQDRNSLHRVAEAKPNPLALILANRKRG
jgi:hypothetical protein